MNTKESGEGGAQPYIGAPVTLISSLDVRYEGTLFTIDPNESTVALQNVRCLGTQGREKDSENAIPASDTIYEFIIFRGENIKSINIQEEKKVNELNDPSILKIGPKGSSGRGAKAPARNERPEFYDQQYRRDPARGQRRRYNPNGGYNRGDNRGRRPYQQQGYDQAARHYRQQNNQRYRRNQNGPYRDNRQQNRKQNQRRGPPNSSRRHVQAQRQQGPWANPGDAKFLTARDAKAEKIPMSADFDFEKATFDKNNVLTDDKKEDTVVLDTVEQEQKEEASEKTGEEEVVAQEQEEEKTSEAKGDEEKKEESPEPSDVKPFSYKYNPDNFFDDLDFVDRSNIDFKSRRKIDAQTFGQDAENYKVRRRRRRGGNGRRRRNRYNNNR